MKDDDALKRAVEKLNAAKAAGEQIFDEGDYIARAVQQEKIDSQAAAASSRQDRTPDRTS